MLTVKKFIILAASAVMASACARGTQSSDAGVYIDPAEAAKTVTLEVQNGAKPGDYTLTLQGQAQVAFAKDAKSSKTNSLVSQPSQPFTLVVKPAAKK